MKKYLNTLRWCIWTAILLPIIFSAPRIFPQLYLLMNQFVYFSVYIALFIWAGAKASRASYSVVHSAFAGPTLLVFSQLIVNTLLLFIIPSSAISEEHHLSANVINIIRVIGGFLFCFPIALGFSALGAYLNKKDEP